MVEGCYFSPQSLQGDRARGQAAWFAAAASLGYISSAADGYFTNKWRVTGKGLTFLAEPPEEFTC